MSLKKSLKKSPKKSVEANALIAPVVVLLVLMLASCAAPPADSGGSETDTDNADAIVPLAQTELVGARTMTSRGAGHFDWVHPGAPAFAMLLRVLGDADD